MTEKYPVSMRKAIEYWKQHPDEIIDINEREPELGQRIIYVYGDFNITRPSDLSSRVWLNGSVGEYGVWMCQRERISWWIPVNESMKP